MWTELDAARRAAADFERAAADGAADVRLLELALEVQDTTVAFIEALERKRA